MVGVLEIVAFWLGCSSNPISVKLTQVATIANLHCVSLTPHRVVFFSTLYFIRMEISTSELAIFLPFAIVKSIVKGVNQHAMGWSIFSTFALLRWKFPSVRFQHSHSL